jgi:hypothetical protein
MSSISPRRNPAPTPKSPKSYATFALPTVEAASSPGKSKSARASARVALQLSLGRSVAPASARLVSVLPSSSPAYTEASGG